jgi:hypothetical protein
LALDAWSHVEVSRVSGTARLFVKGALDDTAASSHNFNDTSYDMELGRDSKNEDCIFHGHLDEPIIIKGTGLHTTPFSPPAGPYYGTLQEANLDVQDELRLRNGDHYVGFEAPTLSASQIWKLPDADATADNWLLGSDGAGNLDWKARLVLNLNRSCYEITQ